MSGTDDTKKTEELVTTGAALSVNPITGVIESGLSLATEVFKYLNTKASKEYLDRLTHLQIKIMKEEAKGYYSDDAMLEDLYKEQAIIQRAAAAELTMAANKKA